MAKIARVALSESALPEPRCLERHRGATAAVQDWNVYDVGSLIPGREGAGLLDQGPFPGCLCSHGRQL